MNILLASAELSPYAKAGGLGDMASSLPTEWYKYGKNILVIIPKYSFIDINKYELKPTDLILYVPMGNWMEFARLWHGKLPNSNVDIYLIENEDYFNRSGIYGDTEEYSDNDRRFIFFSRSIFEAARALNFKPDIIHSHDYHTAFSMCFLKTHYKSDPMFSNCAGVFTINNLAYQGWFDPKRTMEFAGFPLTDFYIGSKFEKNGAVNAMKTGIMFADKITTVSPNYAREIRMEYYSEGMQSELNSRAGDLIGVLNGVFYQEWNPEEDLYINNKYSINNLEIKLENKRDFLKETNLGGDYSLGFPLIGMVTRLVEQKGIDLIINKLDGLLSSGNIRFALLGSGESHYEDYFNFIAQKYPGIAFIWIGYNNPLSHQIIASCDFLLIPSRFEPCGLTQMYALKYGTIPIVRETGGLADTVKEYIPETQDGTGFVFPNYNADDFAFAVHRALNIYNKELHWDKIRHYAMSKEFSSSSTALDYLQVFNWALEKVL